MKKQLLFTAVFTTVASLLFAQNGNVGIGTTTPGTKLDVNGAITNRETTVAVAANAATIPANVSQVQLTGAATASVAVTAPAAPYAGQRLIIYNNTTGGFGAILGGFTIPNGQAMEFAYSNGAWRATNGGAIGGDYDWMKAGNLFPNSAGDTTQNIYHIGGNVGVGTSTPTMRLSVNSGGGVDNTFAVGGNGPVIRFHGGSTTPIAIPTTFTVPYAKIGLATIAGNYVTTSVPGDLVIQTIDTNKSIIFSNDFTTGGQEQMRLNGNGYLGVGTINPQRRLHVEAAAAPVRISNLQTTNVGSNVLTIDNAGDVRSVPLNNMLAGPAPFTEISGSYTATGNEAVIWNVLNTPATVTLALPTNAQVGKSITIVGAGEAISIAGSFPIVANGVNLTSIPLGKRATILGVNNAFGGSTMAWVVIARDF